MLKMPARRVCAAVTASFVLAATFVSAAFASSSDRAPALNSERLVVAAGLIADQPPGRRVPVFLYAWPSQEVLSTQQEGETVPLTLLDEALADPEDGSFTLALNETETLEAFASQFGDVDLVVVSPTENGTAATHTFPLNVSEVRNARRQVEQAKGRGNGVAALRSSIRLDLGRPDSRAASGDALAEWGDTGYLPKVACGSTLKKNHGPRLVAVGEGYNPASGATHQVTYTSGASSELGVATSGTGTYGSFKAGGTVSRSSDSITTWPVGGAGAKRQYKTYYVYGTYYVSCSTGIRGGGTYSYYETRPIYFAGGATYTNVAASPTATYCRNYVSGSSFTKSTTSAVTWSNGANLGPIIGIDLNSKSGYDTRVSVTYSFSANRQLCGRSDYPGGSPVRLVAK
jgi:hypothetical protein